LRLRSKVLIAAEEPYMQNWLEQAERIARVLELAQPGCAVCFRKNGDSPVLGLRVISYQGLVLFRVAQITWLEEVAQMTDEEIVLKVTGSDGHLVEKQGSQQE
jgi:hypothetical protein